MIKLTSTSTPAGMPLGQAEGSALPRVMVTMVSNSSTVTDWSPLQSPTHLVTGVGCVGVGVAGGAGVAVLVAVAAGVVAVEVCVGLGSAAVPDGVRV